MLLAEVMDKEPTVSAIWQWALIGAVAGYFLCRFRAWLLIGVLPAAALLPLGTCAEIWSFDVGPCILREAGHSYVVQTYLALAVSTLGPLTGATERILRHWSKDRVHRSGRAVVGSS
jgi:hypothetical protein